MEAKRPQENALLTGVIWKQILLFFLPVALGTFFQQMYNTVDALVVGNFVGMNALGAVGGATASVINLILGFFVGVSSGATVVIAQQYGAGNRETLSRVVHTAGAGVAGADGGGRPLCSRDADAPPPAGGADGGLRHLPPHLLRRHPADAPL